MEFVWFIDLSTEDGGFATVVQTNDNNLELLLSRQFWKYLCEKPSHFIALYLLSRDIYLFHLLLIFLNLI